MCEKCSLDQLHPTAPSRRSVVLFAASALGGLMLADTASAKDTKAPPKPQNVLSPDAALKKLMEGNARYVEGTSRRHDFKHEREALVGGQNPYAAILSCAGNATLNGLVARVGVLPPNGGRIFGPLFMANPIIPARAAIIG